MDIHCKLVLLFLSVTAALPRDGLRTAIKIGRSRQMQNHNSNVQCGGILRASSGDVTSPSFPNKYPDEVECIWKLIGEDGSRVTLKFTQFQLETSHECEYDYLEVYNGDRIVDSDRIAKLCGTSIPQDIVSRGSSLLLRFHSDFSVARRGFQLQFTRSGCSHHYRTSRGTITSPNHPNKHPLNVDCGYKIEVPSGSIVVLTFQTFNLEGEEDDSGCVYDYVEVYDGLRAGPGQPLGKYCGTRVPPPLRSSSNHMFVRFVADQSISSAGFLATFRAESPTVANPCLSNNGGCNHICANSNTGRRKCACYPGYVLEFDEETCRDVDECSVNNGGCRDQCINTAGGYMCQCRNGYQLANDNRTCINLNECAMKKHRCEQLCRDTDGGYYCECHKGYQVGIDGMSCIDVNECQQPRSFHHCDHACVNTPGSYYCTCRNGFTLSANGRICRDQNECMMGGVKCDQKCVNTPGSYRCECYRGFRKSALVPDKCIDVNECSEGLPDCHTCTNTQGSYYCDCDPGYVQANNRTKCVDVDECMKNNGGCSQLCINTAGGFHCRCESGYNATDPKSRSCVDINECEGHDGKGDCDHMCTNTAGSFKCSCHQGYALTDDGLTCQDIDECQANNGGCHQKCVNRPGNYSCACHDGYRTTGRNGSDVICEDSNECASGSHQCDSGATCVNTPGNYTCICPPGYRSEWNKCIDIDECSDPFVNDCQQVCKNTAGSFHCECLDGYSLNDDKKTCSDIDECKLGMCEKECVNIEGSYLCMCPNGYQLTDDKRHCQDINECEAADRCDQTCVNTNGSFHCECRKGYKLLRDEKTCRDLDECSLNTACCNQDCLNTEGSYNCTCRSGYELSSRCTCTDVNECASKNGGCQQICSNTAGAFRCSCAPGFVVDSQDPSRCQDIDECKTGNGGCQHNCTNTIGTYQCTCHPKFKLQPDGKSCGHCPTCDDFESLIETVQLLKKQVASLEAWRQSIGRGCIDENYNYHSEDSSWHKSACEMCSCEHGQARCEPILGCSNAPSATPSVGAQTQTPPTTAAPTKATRSSTTLPPDDEDNDEASSDGQTTQATPPANIKPSGSIVGMNGLFTINRKKQKLK